MSLWFRRKDQQGRGHFYSVSIPFLIPFLMAILTVLIVLVLEVLLRFLW